jgi:hypothetical protein
LNGGIAGIVGQWNDSRRRWCVGCGVEYGRRRGREETERSANNNVITIITVPESNGYLTDKENTAGCGMDEFIVGYMLERREQPVLMTTQTRLSHRVGILEFAWKRMMSRVVRMGRSEEVTTLFKLAYGCALSAELELFVDGGVEFSAGNVAGFWEL